MAILREGQASRQLAQREHDQRHAPLNRLQNVLYYPRLDAHVGPEKGIRRDIQSQFLRLGIEVDRLAVAPGGLRLHRLVDHYLAVPVQRPGSERRPNQFPRPPVLLALGRQARVRIVDHPASLENGTYLERRVVCDENLLEHGGVEQDAEFMREDSKVDDIPVFTVHALVKPDAVAHTVA